MLYRYNMHKLLSLIKFISSPWSQDTLFQFENALNWFSTLTVLTPGCSVRLFFSVWLGLLPLVRAVLWSVSGVNGPWSRKRICFIHVINFWNNHLFKDYRDFPGGPVVKNLPSNAGDPGSIPGRGTKIPCAATKTRRSQINK